MTLASTSKDLLHLPDAPPPCDPSPRPSAEQSWAAERDSLEQQLALQGKINGELRALLVSTMGDDLTQHVTSLGQDKAILADNIRQMHTVDGLQRNAVDQLAIDTDLWKAKFMATRWIID